MNTLLIDHGAIGDDREADMDLLERVRASRIAETHKRRIIGAIKRK